ncbi:hypothetical protein D3C71_1332690 [compost metagenome]
MQQATFSGLQKRLLQQVLQFFAAAGVGQFNQHMPRVRAVQRILAPRHVGHHDVELVAVDHFKGRQARTAAALEHAQYVQRRLRAVRRHPGHGVARGQGMQLEHGGGDDAHRALGADEQVFKVEARVVLAQRCQPVPDGAVGQHHFQAQNVVAGIAVAQHAGAARVGGDGAANLAGAFGAQADRVQPAFGGGGVLHRGQHAARFDFHGIVRRVDPAHAAHAGQVHNDGRRAGRVWHRAAAQAGVAALGQYRRGVGVAEPDDVSHLLRVARQGDAQRRTLVPAAPVFGVARGVGLGVKDGVGAQGLGQRV